MSSFHSPFVPVRAAAASRLVAAVIGLSVLNVYALPPIPAEAPVPVPPVSPAVAGVALPAAAQGQVKRILINPYGEADGVRLTDGTIVKFPPHMAGALTEAVKPGDMIRVFGRPETRGTVKADAIVNVATAQTVFDQPPAVGEGRLLSPHLRVQRLQAQQVEGRIDAVLTGPRGEVNGVILADGSIVRFPPESLRLSVQAGAPFAASGLGTRNVYGTSLEAIRMGPSLAALQPIYDAAP